MWILPVVRQKAVMLGTSTEWFEATGVEITRLYRLSCGLTIDARAGCGVTMARHGWLLSMQVTAWLDK